MTGQVDELPEVRARVVGVGSSAGGVAALSTFVRRLPPDPGLAFVLVSHLAPTRESELRPILAAQSPVPVVTAADGAEIERGKVYVLPPGRDIEIAEGRLRVLEPAPGPRVPIDRFFRSLADALGRDAACVVLSGIGADGTLGLRAVKEAGGLTLAQQPDDAEHDGMPKSAIATGAVDLVLPVSEMPERLVGLLGEPGAGLALDDPRRTLEPVHDTLRDVLTVVRIRSGHDFSHYKRATLYRRIARRMQVCGTPTIAGYLALLREQPSEFPRLLRDFLISVTCFFRDPDAFAVLQKEIVPRLYAAPDRSGPVRIWVPGCATGEEAYSLAMICAEHAASADDREPVQIFATDIDDDALQVARHGRYPETIASDVSPERLARFFHAEDGHYRVRKELRDRVLFSSHNVLRDPPFSRLGMVSCRNLLIYLDREAQERVLGILHFALRPDGVLFLGSSESAEGATLLFAPLDAKHRVYARRAASGSASLPRPLPAGGAPPLPVIDAPAYEPRAASSAELHQKILEQSSPPSVLVGEDLTVVHVSEHAGRYLAIGGGEPTRDLLRLVHPALRLDLRAAIYAARQDGARSDARVVRVELEGAARLVRLHVRAIDFPERARGMMLVTFDDRPAGELPPDVEPSTAREAPIEPIVVRQLEDELHRTRDQLRVTIEQYETSLEELKASNEELQAMNEELRSATEELETSKEELQSINEEQTTLNQELKDKVEEVSRANSDLQNLITSTDIGVVFLDRRLKIKRFTPRAQDLFNVIGTDVGRPLAHLTNELEYPGLEGDAAQVLQHLGTIEREVRARSGRRFLARLHPYRSVDDRIDGVVLTFLDVTELQGARERVRAREVLLKIAERAASAGGWELDQGSRSFAWSDEAARVLGIEPGSAAGVADLIAVVPPSERDRARAAIDAALARGSALDLETDVSQPDGGTRRVWLVGNAIEERGPRLAGLAIDVTDRRRTEQALRESEEKFRLALRNAPVVMLRQDGELRYTWGFSRGEELAIAGKTHADLFPPDEAARLDEIKRAVLATGAPRLEEVALTIDGRRRFFDIDVSPILEDGRVAGVTTAAVDVTASRQAENALREADRRKDEFLATLAHELRNPLAPLAAALAIQELAGGDVGKMRAARAIMQRQVEHVVRLVDDLLDVSRITQGKFRLRKSPVDLALVIDAALESSQTSIDAARHEVSVALPEAPIRLDGDFARLTQVIVNLLGNAVKYTPPGGHVWISASREDGWARISIRDDGVGIDAAMLPKVFDMFSQSGTDLERAQGGLGIGLALVRSVVELHGGTVEARSEGRGRGAEVVVKLPIEPDASAPAAGAPAARAEKAARKKVLVVDDNRDASDTIAELVGMLGHEVRAAYDGAGALALAAELEPNVVLLDLGMQGTTGYDVCAALRARDGGRALRIVAVSGWGQAEDRARTSAAGFDQHLVKPIGLTVLRELLGDASGPQDRRS